MWLSYLLRGIFTNIWIHFKPLEYTFLPFPGSNVQQLSKNTIPLLMHVLFSLCAYFSGLFTGTEQLFAYVRLTFTYTFTPRKCMNDLFHK